jgi:ribosomal protein S18 acetylase RimI-like enzyme
MKTPQDSMAESVLDSGELFLSHRAASTSRTMLTSVRPCRKEDLPQIAAIHKSQFCTPDALLGKFSPSLITGLYAAFLEKSVFLVCSSNDEIDGFVLGGPSQAIMRCRLAFCRQHALSCAMSILSRPGLWRRALSAGIKVVRDWTVSISRASSEADYCLLAIAVAETSKRRGVGRALVRCFEATIPPAFHSYCLHVLKSNSEALHFYEALAFHRAGETAISWKLRKELSPDSARA